MSTRSGRLKIEPLERPVGFKRERGGAKSEQKWSFWKSATSRKRKFLSTLLISSCAFAGSRAATSCIDSSYDTLQRSRGSVAASATDTSCITMMW